MPPLVLASGSPRRARLLAMLGVDFEVHPAHLEEARRPGEAPAAYAERTARDKASAVAGSRPGAVVLAADTIVVLDGDVLGKPADEGEAVAMLLRLQGRSHLVQTAIAVAPPEGSPRSGVEETRVVFRSFDEATAAAYAATGEPLDKAGAYGIQGYGATLVEAVEGDFFAVMGLPIVRTLRLLEEAGWRYQFRPSAGFPRRRPSSLSPFEVTVAEPASFEAEVIQDGASGGCAIVLPFDPRARFGRVRAPVLVTVSGHTYRSTIFSMGGRYLVPLARAHREAAGVSGGDTVRVEIRPDAAPREVPVPRDLAAALQEAGVDARRWDALSYTRRKEAVRAVEGARKPETRARRIARIVEELAP